MENQEYRDFLQEMQNRIREIRKGLAYSRFKDQSVKTEVELKTWREVDHAITKLHEAEMWLHEAKFEINYLERKNSTQV